MTTRILLAAATAASASLSTLAFAADQAPKQSANVPAIVMFLLFVALTLGITYWAAKRRRPPATTTRRAAASLARRTASRSQATSSRRRRCSASAA